MNNPKHEFEVYTTTDKAKRDELFQALRKSDDPFERQVVKFSGVKPILESNGAPHKIILPNYAGRTEVVKRFYEEDGETKWTVIRVHARHRLAFRSTWSVAHPKAENAPRGRS